MHFHYNHHVIFRKCRASSGTFKSAFDCEADKITGAVCRMSEHEVFSQVLEFYNSVSKDASIHSRVNTEHLTQEQLDVFNQLHDDIKNRYFGSGIPIPEKLEGKRVLDIGCGSGSLVFMLSKFVGPDGYVVGVDYSDGLIETAKAHSEHHWKLWGYKQANFEFHVGDAEKLDVFHWAPESFDLIVSNGVFVLLVDKERAFGHAYSLLKPGGQFYLTDVYAEKDMPPEVLENKELWCGGSGSLRWDKLTPMVAKVGFTTPYLTQVYPIRVLHQIYKIIAEVNRLLCVGWRLFKLPEGVKRTASRVSYKGDIAGYPTALPWDVDLTFKKGEGVDVDGDLATILSAAYLSDSFDISDTSASPTTNRNQNPFTYLDRLEEEGRLPEPMYTVE